MLGKKAEVNFKAYDVTDCTKINYNALLVLPNFSRSKTNQKIKFGQLIEYNMQKIFLEKSYTECGARSFYKTSILSTSLNQQSELLQSLFYCMSKLKSTAMYQNKGADHLLLLYLKLF